MENIIKQKTLRSVLGLTVDFVSSPKFLNLKLKVTSSLVLIMLAKHHGKKGIYPSITTLARECGRSKRYIKSIILKLEHLKLITVERRNGCSSVYYLNFINVELSTERVVLSTDRASVDHPSKNTTEHLQITPPSICGSPTEHLWITQSEQISSLKEQRERASAHTLPVDFLPKRAVKRKAEELGLTGDELYNAIEKFKAHYKSTGVKKFDWDAALDKWLIGESGFKRNTQPNLTIVKNEARSFVPDYVPILERVTTTLKDDFKGYASTTTVKEHMGIIKNKLRSQGAVDHGRNGQMETHSSRKKRN